ncbi:MAG: iron ABC transporter permease [Synergistaceae bacterium]|nr:iron ABC transporter permease [Synergistaceae bacterium]
MAGKVRQQIKFTITERILQAVIFSVLSVFILWPVLSVFAQSFLYNGSFSLRAYQGLFTRNIKLITNSFVLALCVALAAIPISILIAVRLVYGSSRGKNIIISVLALSTISPPFLCSMAYLMLFGRRGLITWRLLGFEWNPYGFHGVLLMEAASLIGLTSLLITAALNNIDGTLEEVSLNLGASPLKTFAGVSLPLALPGILAASLAAFVRSLSDFGTPLFVGGRFQVLASRAYDTMISIGDFNTACAMNVLLVIPALILILIRPSRNDLYNSAVTRQHTLSLHKNFMFTASSAAWLFTLLQIMIYGLIFLGSVTQTWGVDFALTMKHISGIANFRLDSIIRSLLCSLIAGFAGCLISLVIVLVMPSGVAFWLSDIAYLIPGTFFGVGYLLAFTRLPFEVPAVILISACCMCRQLSPVLNAVKAGYGQINPDLPYAIKDLGGGAANVLKDLLAPLLMPFLRLGFLNTFSAAMTATGAIIFLVSPYVRVAAVELFESINEGDFGSASAMGSLLILIAAGVNAIVWKLSYNE